MSEKESLLLDVLLSFSDKRVWVNTKTGVRELKLWVTFFGKKLFDQSKKKYEVSEEGILKILLGVLKPKNPKKFPWMDYYRFFNVREKRGLMMNVIHSVETNVTNVPDVVNVLRSVGKYEKGLVKQLLETLGTKKKVVNKKYRNTTLKSNDFESALTMHLFNILCAQYSKIMKNSDWRKYLKQLLPYLKTETILDVYRHLDFHEMRKGEDNLLVGWRRLHEEGGIRASNIIVRCSHDGGKGKSFFAHREILVIRSKFFLNYFSQAPDRKAKEIRVGLNEGVLECVMNFIYTGEIQTKNIRHLLLTWKHATEISQESIVNAIQIRLAWVCAQMADSDFRRRFIDCAPFFKMNTELATKEILPRFLKQIGSLVKFWTEIDEKPDPKHKTEVNLSKDSQDSTKPSTQDTSVIEKKQLEDESFEFTGKTVLSVIEKKQLMDEFSGWGDMSSDEEEFPEEDKPRILSVHKKEKYEKRKKKGSSNTQSPQNTTKEKKKGRMEIENDAKAKTSMSPCVHEIAKGLVTNNSFCLEMRRIVLSGKPVETMGSNSIRSTKNLTGLRQLEKNVKENVLRSTKNENRGKEIEKRISNTGLNHSKLSRLIRREVDERKEKETELRKMLEKEKRKRKNDMTMIKNEMRRMMEKNRENETRKEEQMKKQMLQLHQVIMSKDEKMKEQELSLSEMKKSMKKKFKENLTRLKTKTRIQKYLNRLLQDEFEMMNLSKRYRKKGFLDFHHKIDKMDFFDAGRARYFEEFDQIIKMKPKEGPNTFDRRILLVDHKKDNKLKEFVAEIKKVYYDTIRNLQYKFTRSEDDDSTKGKPDLSKKKKKKIHESRTTLMDELKTQVESIMKRVSDFYGGCPGDEKACKEEILKRMKETKSCIILLGEVENGVCRHRSILFKIICDMLDIRCRVLRGSFTGTVSITKGGTFLHAWNLIYIGDEYFTVDLMNRTELIDECLDDYSLNFGWTGTWEITGEKRKEFKKENHVVNQIKKVHLSNTRKKIWPQHIGGGTFSNVYEFQIEDAETYALKRVNTEAFPKVSPYFIKKQVKKEVTLLKFVNHENIVKCYGYYKYHHQEEKEAKKSKMKDEDDIYVIVMEFISGNGVKLIANLKKLERRIQLQETLIFLLETAKGLKYLHKLNIVHCDLKPANILVEMNQDKNLIESVKIIDFAGAMIRHRTKLSKCEMTTDGYAAPETEELGEDGKLKYDERADIYSFGKIMGDFEDFFQVYSELTNLKNQCLGKIEDRPSIDEIIFVLRKHLMYIDHTRPTDEHEMKEEEEEEYRKPGSSNDRRMIEELLNRMKKMEKEVKRLRGEKDKP